MDLDSEAVGPQRTVRDHRPALASHWPVLAAVATVPILMLIGFYDDFVEGVVFAAFLYLLWGLARLRHSGVRWVAWQLPGTILFGAFTFGALALEQPYTYYVLAAGWAGHAAWDVVHYRADRVVPRWWSEWCVVLDLILVVLLLATAMIAWP